jgi:hypothetical protein
MGAPTLSLNYSAKDDDGRAYSDVMNVIGEWGGKPKYQQYPSVTTALKMTSKDGLRQWAVDVALKAVIKNPDAFYQRSDQDFFKGFRYAADRVRDERAQIGTGTLRPS